MAGALLAACSAPDGGHAVIERAVEVNAVRFGVPLGWIETVMQVESGGRACRDGHPIRSRTGAAGVMQLMEPTWTEMQHLFSLGSSIDDPAANIAAGTAYLRLMYDRFGYPGVFAAYNAGPERYRQSLLGRQLPKETLQYLHAILARINGAPAVSSPASSLNREDLFILPANGQGPEHRDGGAGGMSSSDALFFLRR